MIPRVSSIEFPAQQVLRLLLVGFMPTLCSAIQVACGQDYDLVSASQEVQESVEKKTTVAPAIVEKPKGEKSKGWWEKMSLGGYAQVRYGVVTDAGDGAPPQLLGDRGIGDVDSFTLRRARLKLQGDVAPHLGIYIQPDFGVAPPGGSESTATYFA